MKVIPMSNRLLIKQDPKIEKIKNGLIYLPESEQHQPPTGYVIAAGPKCEQVKEGDYVQWPMEVTATAFMHNDEEHIVISENGIIAILVNV